MMRSSKLPFRIFVFLVAFSWLGTLATKLTSVDPGPVKPIASILMIASAVWVVMVEIGSWKPLIATALIASSLEICSLFTGVPFGTYEYTHEWVPVIGVGTKLFPLLLPGAWILVVWGCFSWVRQRVDGWAAVGATALLAASIDLPMERAMTEVFRYWKWTPPGPLFGAPILNFFGWALTTFFVVAPFRNVAVTESMNSIRVLSLFCLFVGMCGAVSFLDVSWAMLLLLSILLWPWRTLPSQSPQPS